MVQFQNLDPFQHRAWRYLNVDETGIDDPAWNDAAGEVIRGLDEAIGLLVRAGRPPRRGGPGRQRPRLRPLPGPGPRQPDPDRRGGRPAAGARRAGSGVGPSRRPTTSGSGARSATIPTARSSSFDLSVAAQFPFDWKRTLAFAPHQDTAAMVYLNSTERRRRGPAGDPPADRRGPRRRLARPWPRPAIPRPGRPSSRRSSRRPRPTGSTRPAKATPT